MSHATLMVPGFNGGDPVKLVRFEVSSALRAPGGGRTGRLADWSGRFDLEDASLAPELSDHLDRTFEEGYSGAAEITGGEPGGAFRFEGVAERHRGGVKFAFNAFSRDRAQRSFALSSVGLDHMTFRQNGEFGARQSQFIAEDFRIVLAN